MAESSRTCSNCGAPLQPGARFCERCGTPVVFQAVAGSYAPPPSRPAMLGASPAGDYQGSDPLLEFDIEYPESLSRWMIFVKWLLAIPHWIVLYFYGLAAGVVAVIAWFAILITGQYPRGLWEFVLAYLRWSANVSAYAVTLQRDEYPPFGDAPYPVRYELQYPQSLSRWKIFLKWLLVIPNLFVLGFVMVALYVAVVIAFFAILITGKYPRGLFDFVTGSLRWSHRANAYILLLTDRYPPFSLE